MFLLTGKKKKDKLIKKYYLLKTRSSQKIYAAIKTRKKYLLSEADDSEVRKVLKVYKDWRICFDVSGEEKFLKKCYEELVGFGRFFWFRFDDNGIKDCPLYQRDGISFSPISERNFLVKNLNILTDTKINRDILSNYVKRYVKDRVSKIKSIIRFDKNPPNKYRSEIHSYIEQIMILLRKTGYIEEVISFLYTELIKEATFPWLDVFHGKLVNLRKYPASNIAEIISELVSLFPNH